MIRNLIIAALILYPVWPVVTLAQEPALEGTMWTDDNWIQVGSESPVPYSFTWNEVETDLSEYLVVSLQFTTDIKPHKPQLCDVVVLLSSLAGDGTVMTDYAFFEKRLFRQGRTSELTVRFELTKDSFTPIRESPRLIASCLEWRGEGVPDPYNIPADRPSKLPNQVCNPLEDARGCGQTCLASPTDPLTCNSSEELWPSFEVVLD